MMTIDTETCGLHGVAILLQYAKDDGPVLLHHFWFEPVNKSMRLIESICEDTVVGFNLAFDWFHLQKMYNVLELISDKTKPPTIAQMERVEMAARDGSCVKPKAAIDLMLHFRKTEFQKTMERKDVAIRRVPRVVSSKVADYLNKHIIMDDILFAGYTNKTAPRFKIEEREDDLTFVDIKLRFKPRMGLKVLAAHVLGASTIEYKEITAGRYPLEYGYAPFSACVFPNAKQLKQGKQAWPQVIQHHIDHWQYNALARQYATNDVIYTRDLQKYSGAQPDTDSLLACCVASCRWKGYAIDIEAIDKLIEHYEVERRLAPTSPSKVREFLELSPIEEAIIAESTGAKELKALVKLGNKKARLVLNARKADKKLNVFKKLKKAGRFHASFKVIGALSGRMSGTDGLNAQGIDATKEVRACFPLAFPSEKLMGGDMQSFEISIADAVYDDPELRKQLMTCDVCGVISRGVCVCGSKEKKSFHGLFGMGFFDKTYEEMMATKGTNNDLYKLAKIAGFATLYGAQPGKLKDSLGVSMDKAREGFARFWHMFKVAGEKRQLVTNRFTSMKGVKAWVGAEEAIESLLGFRRYFTVELAIIKSLFNIASYHDWQDNTTIVRNERQQTASGAARSSMFGAAFNMQNAMIRQSANHQIQSTGAGITKEVQAAIWELQPAGVHEWCVRPINIHDEVQVPCKPELCQAVTDVVYAAVEKFRTLIPLIGIDFGSLDSWGDK